MSPAQRPQQSCPMAPCHSPPMTPTIPQQRDYRRPPLPNDKDAMSPPRMTCRMVGRRGMEQPRGGEDVLGGEDVPGMTSYSSFPRFSTTTKREGAPTVPPISTTSLWLVPTAWITRRREFHMPSRFLSFVHRPAARGGRGRRGMMMICSSSFPRFFISRQGGWKGRGQ